MKFGKYQIARTKTGRCRWRNDHTTIYEGIKNYSVSQYNKSSNYTISLNVSEALRAQLRQCHVSGVPEWVFYNRNIWDDDVWQL